MVYRFLAIGVLSCATLLTVTTQRSYGQGMNSTVTLTDTRQTDKPGPRDGEAMSTVSSDVPQSPVPENVPHDVSPSSCDEDGQVAHEERVKKIGKNTKPQFYPPALDKSGNAYFASCSGKITAIDSNGNTKWLIQLPNRISSGFVIGQNNALYFSAEDVLYAIDTDGLLKWTFNTDNAIAFPAIVDKQENVYIVTANDNLLYAIRPDGSLYWKVRIDGDVAMQPSITAEGGIYVAVQNKSLYNINPDGKFHWHRRIFSKPLDKSTPISSTDNDVAIDSTPESLTKPINELQGQSIPEALRISRRKPEIEETIPQQTHESAITSFITSTQKGYLPLTVKFLDTSTGEVIDRNWDFGDGTLVNLDRSPVHTYTIPGSYSIRLITKRADMVSTIIKQRYITVLDVHVSNDGESEDDVLDKNNRSPSIATQISTVMGLPISNGGESDAKSNGMLTVPTQIPTISEGRRSIKYFPQKNRK